MAETIIGGAFVGILRISLSLVDLLETVLAVLVAGVAVGCHFMASLRNAVLSSPSLASRSTSSTS
jgi:hypothetical protein